MRYVPLITPSLVGITSGFRPEGPGSIPDAIKDPTNASGESARPTVLLWDLGLQMREFPVAVVDITLQSFPWFSSKLALIQARIPQKDHHGGPSPCRSRSQKRTIGLKPTSNPNQLPLVNGSIALSQSFRDRVFT